MLQPIYTSVGSTIVLHGLPLDARRALANELSLPNPEYQKRDMLGLYLGDTPKRLYFVEDSAAADTMFVPRGAVQAVRRTLAEHNLRMEVHDRRTGGEALCLTRQPHHDAREYQSAGAEAIRRHLQGTIVLPCGTGKTYLAMLAISAIARTTLVIVPTKDLLYQWAEEAEEHLGVTASLLGDGKKEHGPLTIAIIKSLDAVVDDERLRSFGLVIHDECHRSCAKMNRRVMAKLPARWRLGITATKKREDGLDRLIDWTFGEVLLERSISQMVQMGTLLAPEVIELKTAFQFEYDGIKSRELTALHEAITQDASRLDVIKRYVKERYRDKNSSLLIIANRIPYCTTIGIALQTMGIDAAVVTSRTRKRKRRNAIAKMRSGEIRVMVATSLADEGLDIRRLSDVMLAFPEKAEGKTIQRIGRVMRPFAGKFPKLIDIVDYQHRGLRRRWYKRRSVYRKLELIK